MDGLSEQKKKWYKKLYSHIDFWPFFSGLGSLHIKTVYEHIKKCIDHIKTHKKILDKISKNDVFFGVFAHNPCVFAHKKWVLNT